MAKKFVGGAAMIRLAIIVEGQTEEEFVKELLADHLAQEYGIVAKPILLGGRGGDVNIENLVNDARLLYYNFDYVTTFVDFYGFRKKDNPTLQELNSMILEAIKKKIGNGWDSRKIIPYIQNHEFEGLLFSDVGAFKRLLEIDDDILKKLEEIRTAFATPEDINNSRETAPSKRIGQLFSTYNKPLYGTLLAIEMGLEKIRTECPLFDNWVSQLEKLEPLNQG